MKTKRIPYDPTDIDRATVAAAYDNVYRASHDPIFSPSDYEANGLTVTLKDGGATYWIYTLQEAAETGVCRTEGDVIQIGSRKWIVVLG
jgi:hypothetical protein